MGVETVILAGITWGQVYSGIAMSVLSYGLSYAAQNIFGEEQGSYDYDKLIKENLTGAINPIPVLYGQRIIGGAIAFRDTTGSGNDYLHTVLAFCEGEVDEIEEVFLDEESVLLEKYENLTTVNKHTGTDNQTVDTDANNAFPDQWTSAHRLQGIAYIYIKLKYNQATFSRIPIITAKIKGKTIYDPRTDTTAWSDNPALCIRDYLTNATYGRAIPELMIDDDAITEAANYCEEQIDFKDTGGNVYQDNRYRCNGIINPDENYLDNLKKLLSSCRGMLIFSAGKYKLLIDKPETASFTFDEDNIVGSISIGLGDKRTVYNRLKIRYFDKTLNHEQTYYTHDADQYRSQFDNDQVLAAELTLPFTDEQVRVQAIAQMEVNTSRNSIFCSFETTLEALQVDVGDVVNVSYERAGWENKKFRVATLTLKSEDTVFVSLKEYDSSAYVLEDFAPSETPDTLLGNPLTTPPANLSLQSGTDSLSIQPDGTVLPQIVATWDNPENLYFDRAQVEFKLTASENWQRIETTGEILNLQPVVSGQNYDVRVRAAYAFNSFSAWITQTNHTVLGKTELPQQPDYLTVIVQADGTRQFTWTENTVDKDLAGYRIYFSSNTSHTVDEMTLMHNGNITEIPFRTDRPAAAGEYRFAVVAVDTTGNQSAATYLTATIGEGPLGNVIKAKYESAEGFPGTKTNCYVDENAILVATDSKDWSDFSIDGDTWADWTSWSRSGNTLEYTSEEIDLQSNVIFTPRSNYDIDGSATITYRSKEDGGTYGAYQAISGKITARYVQFKVSITGDYPKIKSLALYADGKIVEEEITDLDTSTLSGSYDLAAGNVRLPITKTYSSITTVFITLQSTGSGWTWELIDKDTSTGPEIKIYNSSGTLADATIDARIRGY